MCDAGEQALKCNSCILCESCSKELCRTQTFGATVIPFPNINPEIFSFDFLGVNFTLRWYAVSYILGFFCAIRIMKYYVGKDHLWSLNKPPINSNQADSLLTYLILGVIVGGRLGYVLFYNLDYYASNPLNIIRIWDGGMAFHGGFLGVCLAVFMYCRANSIPLWSGADLIAISSTPGLLFGRLANFVNAELWGRPTEKPWGVVFPGERAQECEGVVGPCARHPSQIYEAILEGFFLFIVLFLLVRAGAFKRPGLVTGSFAIWYGLSRFYVEYYRVPDPQFFSNLNPYGFAFRFGEYGLTMGQVLSLPMVLVGLILVLNTRAKKG